MNEQEITSRKRKKPLSKNLKLISFKEDSESISPLLIKPVKITKVKDAKRLLSNLIYQFQLGQIENQNAKDLTYMLMSYVNICTQVDFEERLKSLEENVK